MSVTAQIKWYNPQSAGYSVIQNQAWVGEERPIVVYGTSIAHGACASRPGMAWTNILHRRMGHPVVNLGFSGNAYFENGVVELLGKIDASLFVDGLHPNNDGYSKIVEGFIEKKK